jgi:hypothetical protein
VVLTDFRSPLPSGRAGLGRAGVPNWLRPKYHSTIGAAQLDADPGEEIYARFPDGVHVSEFVPASGTAIDGGAWQDVGGAGPFGDAVGGDDPSICATISCGTTTRVQTLMGRRHPGAFAVPARR